MNPELAIIIPCYRVSESIVDVVRGALPYAAAIYCVDDACPEQSGKRVAAEYDDERVRVLFNEKNLGVGGAVKAGYQAALADGFEVFVKLDGDGQMDPGRIPDLVNPICEQLSDYCKGNRFYELEYLRGMPALRLLGNSMLSALSKLSSGYWQVVDPTNGFTAMSASALKLIPLDKIQNGYFFESDLLFRLNLARAVVTDIPMPARYGNEVSSLRIGRVILPFLLGHTRNLAKRIFYSYFLRDFSIASIQLVAGTLLFLFGLFTGVDAWSASVNTGITASAGTVMLAGLPIILGFQLLLSFLNYDIQNQPTMPLSRLARHSPKR
ncbi:MAG: glycosyltransferase family 2 protein [Xanthomonadales bacterium]|nr:glycosyltransferase family 2 protein [Xanthomonadales bacterium]